MFTLWHGDRCITIDSPLLGRFNVYNSLAAAASASGMNIPLNEIKEGLELFKGMSMRFEIKIHRGIVFLNDVYNANPSSMEESLRELVRLAGISRYKRIIAVLGDMLELGAYSDSAHRNIGNLLSDLAIDIFIGVGPEMAKAVEAFQGKGIHVPTSEAASGHLLAMINEGDIVLVKGSRGMRMEQVLQGVMEADYAL
jgi:UDP-N-acetylmuramoyl-tripeptide--D-alanyl-D-alanine ligase